MRYPKTNSECTVWDAVFAQGKQLGLSACDAYADDVLRFLVHTDPAIAAAVKESLGNDYEETKP